MFDAENRRGRWRGALVACLTAAIVATACSGTGDGTSGTREPPTVPSAPGSGRAGLAGQVGNQASGIDAMPDWNAAALRVREQISPRLPDPLPAPTTACRSMLDAALQFYTRTEGEASKAATTIERTRAADERACTAETSPAAATCVTILLEASAGEYPWLVDQCSRAFPT